GDIVRALTDFVRKNGVKVFLNTKVSKIEAENGKVTSVIANNKKYSCDSVIIATGGLSYPVTGSTGDGYKFAKSLGHSVTKCYPSLVPLKVKEKWVSDLMGLSLKNVELSAYIDNKEVYRDFGEMLFTHFGVSGPLVLSLSRFINDKLDKKTVLKIDLKPALDNKTLDARLLKDFQKYANKDFKNALGDLLPQKLIPVIIKLSGIDEFKKVNSITKEERLRLLNIIKNLKLTAIDTTGYNEAVITSGGVNVDEIDPSTMESKIIKGLFFAGEVIDCDAFTGGYNLQIAFSTAYLAGNNC
ncbi:MAG: NAD(P)/FAD-dependent oxidoreductase, partial [Lachnospirales bacterium]